MLEAVKPVVFATKQMRGVNSAVPISVVVNKMLVLNGKITPTSKAENTLSLRTVPAVLSFLSLMLMLPIAVVLDSCPTE